MNWNTLFKKQQELDLHIVQEKGLEGQPLLDKKVVALICELYECVNEARFFKFWSDDQKPNRTGYVKCDVCTDQPGRYEVIIDDKVVGFPCPQCEGYEEIYVGDRLLEEYADVMHFALSVSNHLGYHEHEYTDVGTMDLSRLTLGITNLASLVPEFKTHDHIELLLNYIIKLGYQLGFDEQQVIEAYNDKHKENYRRQKVGY